MTSFGDFSKCDQDELLAVARRAAARAHRIFPDLAPFTEDVTQNAYVAMLQTLRRNDPGRGKLFPFVYVCCLRSIICGWMDRDDYRLRRASKLDLADIPEKGYMDSPDSALIARELMAAADLSEFEMSVVSEYYWMGSNNRESAEHLGYTEDWVCTAKNAALRKLRAVMGMAPLPKQPGGRRAELSGSRGARSMRRRRSKRIAPCIHRRDHPLFDIPPRLDPLDSLAKPFHVPLPHRSHDPLAQVHLEDGHLAGAQLAGVAE